MTLPERALMALPSYHWLLRRDAVISDRGGARLPDHRREDQRQATQGRGAPRRGRGRDHRTGSDVGPVAAEAPDSRTGSSGSAAWETAASRPSCSGCSSATGSRPLARRPAPVRRVRSHLGLVALLFGPILIGIAAVAFALPTGGLLPERRCRARLVGLGVLCLAALPDLLAAPLRRRTPIVRDVRVGSQARKQPKRLGLSRIQRSTYSRERRPRSRCQERYAATTPLASFRCRGSAAWTAGQSPASRAPRTAIDSGAGLAEPGTRQVAHSTPPDAG